MQLALLLLTQTDTATVGGLETFFTQDKMFGVSMQPSTVIILSVFLGLKTSILIHVKIFSLKKGFFGFKAKTATFLWGLVAKLRAPGPSVALACRAVAIPGKSNDIAIINIVKSYLHNQTCNR